MQLIEPVTLVNAHVRLEPLGPEHAADLAEAAAGLAAAWYTAVPTPDAVPEEIANRLAQRDAGTMNPWAVVTPGGTAVGMTTFCAIDQPNRRVEIGYTWLALRVQRTAINSAAKLLLLGHAFDECDVIAVEFRTHWHNRQSRAAIERLGARQDGVLRNHRIGPDGLLRDTVVYSILPGEWPSVQRGLTARLDLD
ncbi:MULTISPECIES: GNAT family N-acetyltransferase [unclassified Microbacterium]|uniref:GNAT family N-acetyltransferase n=1 Tax=unclassified Microbacterium TaxID=2609290 RepID=UPI003745A02F